MDLLRRRGANAEIRELLRDYPAVGILGPRQAGKTTLVRTAFPKSPYWDCERPSDRAQLQLDPEQILRDDRRPIILDEAQIAPELFPVLRAIIDEKRKKHGRFLILGSASPTLIRGLSETLAGRIGYMELDPFNWTDVAKSSTGRSNTIWTRGGFPDAFLAKTDRSWWRWLENYIRSFIERDLGLLGFDFPAPRMHKFSKMVAHLHGGIWNASQAGGSLGVSYHTAQRYVEILEKAFLIRLLPPWHANLKKRLVKAPKVYWRDSGLLHHLLGIEAPADILNHPMAGASWEGFVIEQIIRNEKRVHPSSEFYFFRTHTGLECDLLIKRAATLIAVEIKFGSAVESDTVGRLREVMDLLHIKAGHIVCNAPRTLKAGPLAIWNARSLLAAGKTL